MHNYAIALVLIIIAIFHLFWSNMFVICLGKHKMVTENKIHIHLHFNVYLKSVFYIRYYKINIHEMSAAAAAQ